MDEAIANIARENKISPEKLKASVEAQGMPYALYRERIRGEIEHARVINDLVASKARVDDKELREIYDKEIAKQPKGGDEFYLRVLVVTPQGDVAGRARGGVPAGGRRWRRASRRARTSRRWRRP